MHQAPTLLFKRPMKTAIAFLKSSLMGLAGREILRVQRIVEFNKGRLEAGSYNYLWNGENKIGENVTSGIYFYEMKAGDKFREIKKMTLVK